MSPPPRPSSSRACSTSHATAVRSLKRLSLSFPVQPELEQGKKTYPSSSCTLLLPSTPILRSERTAAPTDSSTFLIALAAQERQVLELKEELQKAEMDLDKLKKQWALHEATRKRDEIRNIGRLEPLKGAVNRPNSFESRREGARKNKELERRRAMYVGTRQPQRKIFSASRHTRALSLLASNPSTCDRKSRAGKCLEQDSLDSVGQKLERSSTFPDSMGPTGAPAEKSARASMPTGVGPPGDVLMQAGKQIVGDFKEGLWTFIEDLKQATVGDEAVRGAFHSPDNKASPSPTNRKTARKPFAQTALHFRSMASPKRHNVTIDVPPGYSKNTRHGSDSSIIELNRGHWERNGVESTPTATYNSNPRDVNKDETVIDEDGWDSWDSPTTRSVSLRKWSGGGPCASEQPDSSSTYSSSRRTSMRYVAFR